MCSPRHLILAFVLSNMWPTFEFQSCFRLSDCLRQCFIPDIRIDDDDNVGYGPARSKADAAVVVGGRKEGSKMNRKGDQLRPQQEGKKARKGCKKSKARKGCKGRKKKRPEDGSSREKKRRMEGKESSERRRRLEEDKNKVAEKIKIKIDYKNNGTENKDKKAEEKKLEDTNKKAEDKVRKAEKENKTEDKKKEKGDDKVKKAGENGWERFINSLMHTKPFEELTDYR